MGRAVLRAALVLRGGRHLLLNEAQRHERGLRAFEAMVGSSSVEVPLWLAPWILCTVLSQLLCISIAERLFSLRLGRSVVSRGFKAVGATKTYEFHRKATDFHDFSGVFNGVQCFSLALRIGDVGAYLMTVPLVPSCFVPLVAQCPS